MEYLTTILYLTDNSLDKKLETKCQENIARASNSKPIVSVSQKPLDFGYNVCVGDIGRSGLSIDRQMKAGLDVIDTEYVAIAEHDCMYTQEHFDFVPPDKKYFWYNDNVYLVQASNPKFPEYDGMYSYTKGRRVQSQLICGTDALREVTDRKIAILSDPGWLELYPTGRLGEPGTNHLERTERLARQDKTTHLWPEIKEYITKYNAKDFKTKQPNLDIRHKSNFTGQRRGKNRTFDLAPWGKFKNII